MAGAEDPGREAWMLLFQLFRQQRREFAAAHAELGLNPAQGHLLMNLDDPRGATMTELAEALACDASYITGLVDRLEERGLVQRAPSLEDRRIKRVVMTEAGIALRRDFMVRMAQPPAVIQALPPEDLVALRDIFLKATRAGPEIADCRLPPKT